MIFQIIFFISLCNINHHFNCLFFYCKKQKQNKTTINFWFKSLKIDKHQRQQPEVKIISAGKLKAGLFSAAGLWLNKMMHKKGSHWCLSPPIWNERGVGGALCDFMTEPCFNPWCWNCISLLCERFIEILHFNLFAPLFWNPAQVAHFQEPGMSITSVSRELFSAHSVHNAVCVTSRWSSILKIVITGSYQAKTMLITVIMI